MTFISLDIHQESVPIPRKLGCQTARTTKPYQCQQRPMIAEWDVPDHSHSCDSFVVSLGGLKRASMSKCVFDLLNDLCSSLLVWILSLRFLWGDSIYVLEGSAWSQSPLSGTSRWEGTTAPQHWGCSTMHPSQSLSTGPLWSWEHFHTSTRVEGQTPTHLLVRHGLSEAISAKWPWGSLLTRHSQSMHRHSYSRVWQQQHQSPPQRGPTQGEAHSKTPSRSLLICLTFAEPAICQA